MDMLDRLGRLLRTLVPDDEIYATYDPDLASAWEELDAYLDEAQTRPRRESVKTSPLEEAYTVLELPPGATMEQARENYKRLLRKYHPDRFAGRPEKQRAATEVTQAVIGAYRTIRRSSVS